MKYIINLSIVFEPGTRILALKNDAMLSIELTKPASRLLCELIENNRSTRSKDLLIQNVWVNYGFTHSKANLSNHISELRKAFVNLGQDSDVIVTVPKVGFRMEAEIHPVAKPEKITKELMVEEGNAVLVDETTTLIKERTLSRPEKKTEKIQKSRQTARFKIITLVVVLLLASAAGITFMLLQKNDVIPLATTIGKCNIYNLNNTSSSTNFIENITNELKKQQVNCTHETLDIYYTETRSNSNLQKMSLMAICKYNDETHYQSCLNHKSVK
jgi:DNA-binding winged helix-turn-helix (wHTH) protein